MSMSNPSLLSSLALRFLKFFSRARRAWSKHLAFSLSLKNSDCGVSAAEKLCKFAAEKYLRDGKADELREDSVDLYCDRRRACASTTGDTGPGDDEAIPGARGDDRRGFDACPDIVKRGVEGVFGVNISELDEDMVVLTTKRVA